MVTNKTIKFFISSTFKDFLKERNALQNFVFPRLKKLCSDSGFSFQPVDLRWGVTSESSDDNQTMNFCLNEIKRCSSEPKPNLLVLLGQRYGWGPLPSEINAKDFKSDIESDEISDNDKKFLLLWYLLDTNSIPHVFYLKDKKNAKNWSEDEKRLKNILIKAVGNNDKYKDFFKSATELEIRDALDNQFIGNKDNTLVYLRSFSTTDDKDYYQNSDEKQKKLINLKIDLENATYSLVEQNNIDLNDYKKSNKDTYVFEELSSDLQYFCNEIFEKYSENIRREINNYAKYSDLVVEAEEQKKFLKFKSDVVLGRDNEVKEIKAFILNSDKQYYLLYGKSGSGKSSVMAQAILDFTNNESKDMLSNEYKVLYRFIGATAHTSSPRDTFEHIYWELTDEEKKPFIEYDDHKFYTQFRIVLESYDEQVIIFMDAVDQFNTYDSLSIFLDKLPKNVKVIFSILNKHKQEENINTLYYERLSSSILNAHELDMLADSNEAILNIWLTKSKRTLTKEQSKYLLIQSKEQTPLYLRLAFIIAKEWKSSYLEYENDIKGDEKELILKFFEKLEKDHYHKNNLIELVLGLISASKDGLSESELIDLLSHEEDILKNYERENSFYPKLLKLPDAIFSRLYFNMQEFFTEKLIDGEILITPFHRIINETIKSKYYKSEAVELHTKLSTYFLTLQDKNKTWDERYNNIHMLSETPYQLFQAKNSKGLKEILFDLEFAGSVYDNHKQNSFRNIMKRTTELAEITEDEIYVWESFYREKEHLITKVDEKLWRPHQSLFQFAYADGINSPLNERSKELILKKRVIFQWVKRNIIPKSYKRQGIEKVFLGHTDSILNVIQLITNDILSCSFDGKILLWDEKGNLKRILHQNDKNDKYYYNEIDKLNSGNILVRCDFDNFVLLSNNGTFLTEYEIKEKSIDYIEFLEDGNFALYGYGSWNINIYNEYGKILSSLKECIAPSITPLKNYEIMIEDYAKDNDGTIDYDERITYIYNYSDKKIVKESSDESEIFDLKKTVTKVALTNGDFLIYGNGNLERLSSSGILIHQFDECNTKLRRIIECSNGFIAAEYQGDVFIWDVHGKLIKSIFKLHDRWCGLVGLHDNTLLTYGPDGVMNKINLENIVTDNETKNLKILFSHQINKNRFLSITKNNMTKYDVHGKQVSSEAWKDMEIEHIFLLKFKQLLLVERKNSLNLVTLSIINFNGKKLHELQGHTSDIIDCCELLDNTLVTISKTELIIWNKLKTGIRYIEKIKEEQKLEKIFTINKNSFIGVGSKRIIKYNLNGGIDSEVLDSIHDGRDFNKVNMDLYYTENFRMDGENLGSLHLVDLKKFKIYSIMEETTKKYISLVSILNEEKMLLLIDKKYKILMINEYILVDIDYDFIYSISGYNLIAGIVKNKFELIILDFYGKKVFSANIFKEGARFLGDINYDIKITKNMIWVGNRNGVYQRWSHGGKYLGIVNFPILNFDKFLEISDNHFLFEYNSEVLIYELINN